MIDTLAESRVRRVRDVPKRSCRPHHPPLKVEMLAVYGSLLFTFDRQARDFIRSTWKAFGLRSVVQVVFP